MATREGQADKGPDSCPLDPPLGIPARVRARPNHRPQIALLRPTPPERNSLGVCPFRPCSSAHPMAALASRQRRQEDRSGHRFSWFFATIPVRMTRMRSLPVSPSSERQSPASCWPCCCCHRTGGRAARPPIVDQRKPPASHNAASGNSCVPRRLVASTCPSVSAPADPQAHCARQSLRSVVFFYLFLSFHLPFPISRVAGARWWGQLMPAAGSRQMAARRGHSGAFLGR